MDRRGIAVAMVATLAFLSLCSVPATAASPALLTTSMVPSNPSQASQLGIQGAKITYNNTLSSSESVLVIASVINQQGQTVSYSLSGSTISPGTSATFFFGMPTSLHGNFTVAIFVTTMTLIPLSGTTLVRVTV